jgi:peptidoglycan hydrolase CwlO-like protein
MQILNKKNIFLILGIVVALFWCGKHLYADTDCSTLTGDAQDQCNSLEKKAKVYQDLIDLKNKQQDTLASQLDNIGQQQTQNKSELQDIQKQLVNLDQQIQQLERSINDKQTEIDGQKAVLGVLMQTYYDYDQQGVLNLVLMDKDFSDTFSQSDYTQQSSTRVSEVLDTIQKAKDDLLAQQEDLNQKIEENNNLKDQLTDKSSTLQSLGEQKQSLLTQTQGEEAKYQQLLASVEAQRKELFDFSAASNLSDVIASIGSYKQPDQKYWDIGHFYSQTDSRWGNMKIGGTKYLMRDYGCAITSVAMVYDFEGKNYTPKTILTSSDFIKKGEAIIYWPDGWYKAAFNKDTINNQLKNGKVVIAHITKGNTDGHFVVIHHYDSSANNYVVNDPYFGPNLYLGTSMNLLEKLGTDIKTSVNYIIISN